MGDFCTPTYSPQADQKSVIEGTEIPEWVAAAGRDIFNSAVGIAGSPYPNYTGERFASYDGGKFSADELAGQEILRSGSENYLPYMNRASGIANTLGGGYDSMSREELMGNDYSGASRGYLEGDFKGLSSDELLGQYSGASREELLGNYQGATREELLGQGVDPFSMENAQGYMDMYQRSMDPAVREIQDQTIQAQNQARSAAARSGAFGGSRLGILEGTAAGEGAQAAGDLRAQAAREGLGFAAGRYDQDVAQSERDRSARFGAEDVMRGRFMDDQASRFGAEDVMRGQFMEDRAGRFSAEDARRTQAENDRSARFSAEDTMYGRYGDQRAARFRAEDALRTGFETDEASRIAQMNAYQGMGSDVMALQNQAAAGLISSGEAQRLLDQRALDFAYADYMDQKSYPQEMVNFALGALSGTPYNQRKYRNEMGTIYKDNPSIYGQALAGIGAGYSAYRMGQ